MPLRSALAAFLFALSSCLPAFAQLGGGGIKGTVTMLTPTGGGSINNSASGSGSFFDHTPTLTIPANTLGLNKLLRVSVTFKFTSGSAPPTLITRLKAGSTVIYQNAASSVAANASSYNVTVQYMLQGAAAPGSSVNVEVSPTGTGNSTVAAQANNIANPVALATNADIVLTIGTQFSAAGTGTTTVAPTMFFIEELN